jgi:hypothetical protein
MIIINENYRIESLSQAHAGIKIENWISSIVDQDESFKSFLATLNIES